MSDFVVLFSLISTLVAYASAACLSTRCRLLYAAGSMVYILLVPLSYYNGWSLFFLVTLWLIGIPILAATLLQLRRVRHSRFPKWYRALSVVYPAFLTLLMLLLWSHYWMQGEMMQVPSAWMVLSVVNLIYWGASLFASCESKVA